MTTKIFHIFVLMLSAILMCSAVYSDTTVTRLAKVWNVEKITNTEIIYIIESRCTIQKVPQYRTVQTQTNNNVLPGIIIGGIIGGTSTKSDQGAVVGSILGGLLGQSQLSTSTQIIGYISQRICQDVNVPVEAKREISIVHWKRNNLRGHFLSEDKHWVGQSVYVDVLWGQ